MKYLLVKALAGFGDRLESLKMCIKYAQDHNLKILVDWTDSTWCHDTESFYKYFSLDMPTFTIEEVEGLSVYPPYWKDRLRDKMTSELIKKEEVAIGRLLEPFPADVIVATCDGIRSIFTEYAFFTKVFKVIDPRVIQEVKRRQQAYSLSKKWGIHLRGTDRAGGINYKLDRITALGARLVAHGIFNAKAIVVSDDEEYIRIWKTRWPDHPILTTVTLNSNKGSHTILNPEVSKDTLNVNLLVDFFTLASCSRVFTTAHDSRFAREAQKANPNINELLG